MAFNTFPVVVTGPSYQSRSKPLSSQQTKNWKPQLSEEGKDNYVLTPFEGLKNLGYEAGIDRGLHRMVEVLYHVKGTSLWRVDSSGNHTELGSIPGADRAIMADDGVNLFIVSDLKVWQYNSDSGVIGEVTDSQITGAKSVDFISNFFIYTFDDLSTVSAVGNGAISQGQVGEEVYPDDLVRDYVFDEVIYRCGTRSVVAWYISPTTNPPISRFQGRTFNVGLSAKNSIAQTDNFMYWLGDDYSIYAARAGAHELISTDAISHEIKRYDDVTDAVGNAFTIDGVNYYAITFPIGNKTFVYTEGLGNKGWFEISSGIDSDEYQGTSFINCYGKSIVADVSNGNIYELDPDTYTNNGDPIQRVRVTSNIDSTPFGAQGKRVQMSEANFYHGKLAWA